jgi:hypothetical protein
MTNRTFRVRVLWDEEANVFYSESDIVGLHVEAPTFEEFEAVLMEVAPDLIVANHMTSADFASTPLRDLMPAIVLEMPLARAS